MAKQKDLDITYMKMAVAMSELSCAKRKKVGAVVVSEKGYGVIAEGFNGTWPGADNNCEREAFCIDGDPDREINDETSFLFNSRIKKILITLDTVLHAEENAIAKIAESTSSSRGATLYCTCAPCIRCARQIVACKIKRVVYLEIYRNDDGLKLLEKAGISVDKVQLSSQNKLDEEKSNMV